MNSWHKTLASLFATLSLTPWTAHPGDAKARRYSEGAISFQLCSSNVRTIGLYKQSGSGNLWHFVVVLNERGTSQFKELEKRYFGKPAEIVWVGVKFGHRRLDIVNLSATRNLMLVSRWETYSKAQARMSLLHDRLLHKPDLSAPCGAQVDYYTKKATSI